MRSVHWHPCGDGTGRHRFGAAMTAVGRRPRGSGKNLGQAKVCEDYVAVMCEEDVRWFDVPVYYAARVQVFESTN
jgi:hypothetical protein